MHSIKLKIGVNNTLRNTIFQISVNVPLRWLLGLRKLSSIIRKHYFLLWTKEAEFFPYFYHGFIIYVAELFDCAVNFKFYLNIFIFLNHKHKSNIKGAIFELRRSHLFRITRTKRFCRNSRPNVFSEKGVLKNFAKWTGKHL